MFKTITIDTDHFIGKKIDLRNNVWVTMLSGSTVKIRNPHWDDADDKTHYYLELRTDNDIDVLISDAYADTSAIVWNVSFDEK